MRNYKQYIAVDLGAESGRVMLGVLDGEQLELQEAYRFINDPIKEGGALKWDFEAIFEGIKEGIGRAVRQAQGQVTGIGVNSWGVDFGLLDKNGQLLENPYHYRDKRTDGMPAQAFAIMERDEIFENSGIQFMPLNSLYQLLALKMERPEVLERVEKLLFMADLVSYFLTGKIYAEYTLASTSQMMDMRKGEWSQVIFDRFGLPLHIMPEVVQAGTWAGRLTDSICQELSVEPIKVFAVGSHDTAGAVAAVPGVGEDWALISSGTWSVMGVEIDKPIINDHALKYGFTNEGGVEGTIRFLTNLAGLWPLQQCRKHWQSEGEDLSYRELVELARQAEPFAAFLNPGAEGLFRPGNIPIKINEYLKKTGQNPLTNKGRIVRVILEGLALQYVKTVRAIETIRKKFIEVIHIVGGGSRNELLSQFTADATGKKVITGPVEATAMGNVIVQAIADGQIESVSQGREIVRRSCQLKTYLPGDTKSWARHYQKWIKT